MTADSPAAHGRAARARPWLRFVAAVNCLALLAAVGVYVVWPGVRAYAAWSRAERAYAGGDLAAAREELGDYLNRRPTSGQGHYLMARALRRLDDFAGARRHLKLARRHGWPTVALDLEYKLIQAQSGGVRSAERALHELLATDHPEAEAVFEALVAGYLRNNLLNDAHRWATAWAERFPGNWRPLYARGQVLERGLKLALAADDYREVLARDPGHAEAKHRLAQILVRIGRFDEARPYFEAYRETRPDDALAVVGHARCLRALGRGDDALALLDRFLDGRDGSAALFVVRGQLDFDRERYDDALAWLRRAEALTPNDREMLQSLADVTKRLGRDEAAAAYEKRRQDVEADVRKVEALIKDALAAETARDGPRDYAKIVELRYELAQTLIRLGHDAEASQWLLSVLQEDPQHAGARRTLDGLMKRTPDNVRLSAP